MPAEEVYLLDNVTYIEFEFFARLRGHYRRGRTQVIHLIGKEMQWVFHCLYHLPACREFFIPGGTNRLTARNRSVQELSKNIS